MKTFLQELRKIAVIGIVGGSDKPKQEEQMGGGAGNRGCGTVANRGCGTVCLSMAVE